MSESKFFPNFATIGCSCSAWRKKAEENKRLALWAGAFLATEQIRNAMNELGMLYRKLPVKIRAYCTPISVQVETLEGTTLTRR